MADTTYSYEGPDFEIRDGILKGISTPFHPKYNNYGELILESFKANPEFIGQIDGGTLARENFRQMMEKSVKCATWLRKENIVPGDVIGICTQNRMDLYVPFLASMYIGAVINPWWDNRLTKDLVKHFVTLTRPKVLFIQEALTQVALEGINELDVKLKFVIIGGEKRGFQSLDEIIFSQNDENVGEFRCTRSISLDDPAFINYTSGTTGLPKGIVTTHKSIFGNSPNFIELGKFTNEDVVSINFSSISWGVGIACLLRSLIAPETRIIFPEFQLEIALRLIEKFKINLMHLSPRKAYELHKSPVLSNYDLSSLKRLWISGGVLKAESQTSIAKCFPHACVYQAYGASELGGVAFRQKLNYKPNSCGTIVKNMRMKVIDPVTGRILGPNEPGEACLKSPFMMTKYYNNPEATRKSIDSEGWLHSGDLVHYDDEGHVYVTDRIAQMINYRGHLISPETTEQAMYINPDIFSVAVVSIRDRENDEHPVAFVVKVPGSQVTEKELEETIARVLSDHKGLHCTVKFLDKIPRLPSGKVARAELKKLAESYHV